MLRLINSSRAYDWGSAEDIPRFMGVRPNGVPVAEIWMGTHPLGASRVTQHVGTVPLSDIAGELPFLLKILAADRPLSLQVHPNEEMAQAGFAQEEAAGMPLDSPMRIYKDPHHKPEMTYALSRFDTLVGFRPTAEILRVLGGLDTALARRLAEDLSAEPGFAGIVRLVESVLAGGVSAEDIKALLAACRGLVEQGIDIKRAYLTALEIAEYFPEDVGVVISLALNRLTLQPGEAAFLGSGIIHAHLSGMCLEVMASSDNVLRAGLTTKRLDPIDLVRCLDKGMSRLARVSPEQFGFSTDVFTPDVKEFALSVSQCSRGFRSSTPLPPAGRRIVVCTGGEVDLINAAGDRLALARGDSVYAGPDDGDLYIVGTGEVAQAYAPGPGVVSGEVVDIVRPERELKRGRRDLGRGVSTALP